MSKKLKKKSNRKKKVWCPPPAGFPDFRDMERSTVAIHKLLSQQEFNSEEEVAAFLGNYLASGKPFEAVKETPLEKAQDLVYDAWKTDGKKRVELALKALQICEDCADAYVILAQETAKGAKESFPLYQMGVAAGERTLGKEMFAENEGDFWMILETRPYMRAKVGLAECLWAMGDKESARQHFNEMLRLNPNDNQAVRYRLLLLLIEEGRGQDLQDLLLKYEKDIGVDWPYGRALWEFRQVGASPQANTLLQEAIERNPLVPPYLLGRKKIPDNLPNYYGTGDESEAIVYVSQALLTWQQIPGAVQWLADVVEQRLTPFSG